MLKDTVLLDAAMPVSQAVRRLAQHGYWTKPLDGEALAWLKRYTESVRRVAAEQKEVTTPDGSQVRALADYQTLKAIAPDRELSVEQAATLLARPPEYSRVVIRRQHFTTIFWYARTVDDVLTMLSKAVANATVLDALNLHEYTADKSAQAADISRASAETFSGILLNGQIPLAVGDPEPRIAPRSTAERSSATNLPLGFDDDNAIMAIETSRKSAAENPSKTEVGVTAFGRLNAPQTVVVGEPFDFTIGLSSTPTPNLLTTGGMRFSAPAGATSIPAEVHIIADGFDIDGRWRRPFPIQVADPMKAEIKVKLTPRMQNEALRLTSIAVHYLLDGVSRGSASFHVVVKREAGTTTPGPDPRGVIWNGSEIPPASLSLASAVRVPDIEVDIAKPDGNAAKGSYSCVIRTSHGVTVPDGSFPIELGDDANTFAKSLIDEVRVYSGHPIVNNFLENVGSVVAQRLPKEFWDALRAVAKLVTGRAITLQLNSAEPYVPWELALVDPALDPTRPNYLGAQVVMGRWILGDPVVASPPNDSLNVKAMAIMAGMYNAATGLTPLPKALEEAADLTRTYQSLPAIPLQSTLNDFYSLLNASLQLNFKQIGGAEAVHLVGHGEVDPRRPGDAAFFLSSGQPLTPFFFLRSDLGSQNKPFIFLNACMVGTGGELLGQFGGFPGACLHGGFTGLIGPLWAVNDDVAKSFALAFYKQALTSGTGRPVAEVLRDLRANYTRSQPIPSYLAYVYYGNPFLTLTTAPRFSEASTPALSAGQTS